MFQQLAALTVSLTMVLTQTAAPLPSRDSEDIAAFMNGVNEAHRQIDAPLADVSAYYYNYSSGKPLFTLEDGTLLAAWDGVRPEGTATFSAKEAKAEVEWIFRMLRTQYGLYQWSGGDAAFEAAEDKILASLPVKDDAAVKLADYEKLLIKNLSFLNDTHFMINRTNLCPVQLVYTDESRPFYQQGGKFYSDRECTRQVLTVDGQAPEKMIRRAIGENGQLTWYIYATAPKADDHKVTIRYMGKTESLTLHPAVSFENQKPDFERFGYQVENGIPFAEINEMFFGDDDASGWADLHDEQWKQAVLKTASEFKKYSAAVIDLTHNGGGNGDLPLEWFRTYTGQEPQPNYCTMRVRTRENWIKTGYGAQSDQEVAAVRERLDSAYGKDNITSDGAYYVEGPSTQFLSNPGPAIFVLTSRNTASAAEGFTDILHNLENVVTIGTNTGGVLTNGANYGLKLPHSGFPFQFGECLFLWDKEYFEEGRGMAPDLYLTGDNLDGRLQSFLQRYASGTLNHGDK